VESCDNAGQGPPPSTSRLPLPPGRVSLTAVLPPQPRPVHGTRVHGDAVLGPVVADLLPEVEVRGPSSVRPLVPALVAQLVLEAYPHGRGDVVGVVQLCGEVVVGAAVPDHHQSATVVLTLLLRLPERPDLVGDELVAQSGVDLEVAVTWDLFRAVRDTHA